MNFRTEIQLQKGRNQINYNSKLLLIGSCFSENIGEKLDYFKFQTHSNPFGIVYNPAAIENIITKAINNYQYSENDIFELNECWHCFDAHSNLSAPDKTKLLGNLNTALQVTNAGLKNASHIIITLGTSWAYRFIEKDFIVGNCHKVPQKKFLKEMLSVKKVIASLDNSIALIKAINPTSTIIFTVSPVRHLKDGFVENSQSKAHLISAINEVTAPQNNIFYFPSYEVMMDDLRDYRFYKSDLIHPNETAINYIWEHFKSVWFDASIFPIMKEVATIQKGLAHKPFHPESEKHKTFLKTLQQKIAVLTKKTGIIFS